MKWFPCNYSGGGNTKDKTVTFTQSQKRENIASGENHGAIFGKIARYFSDLKTVAFTGNYNDLSGKPQAMPPSSHNHTKSQISDFPLSLSASDVKAWAKAANKPSYNWSEIGNKPQTFAPSSHSHSYLPLSGGDVSGEVSFSPANNNSGIKIVNSKTGDYISISRSQNYDGGDNTANIMAVTGWNSVQSTKLYVGQILFNSVIPQFGVYHAKSVNSIAGFFISLSGDVSYIKPSNDNTHVLGDSGSRWKQIYCGTSAISTSDKNKKKHISYIGDAKKYDDTYMGDEKLISFIMGLMPCIYKFIDNDSNRPHHGLVSQDIEKLLQSLGIKDHAAFIKSPRTTDVEVEEETEREIQKEDGTTEIIKEKIKKVIQKEIPGEYDYFLRYEEFIADIIRFCQILYNKNEALENTMQGWQQKTEELEGRIAGLEEIINNRA